MTEQEKQIANVFKNSEVNIIRGGAKIVLPNEPREMTEDEAIEQLERKKEQLKMEVAIHEPIDCFPLEGAWALMQCLANKYGWVNAQPTPGFFGPKPPQMVQLETGYGEYTQVIWGDFNVPGVKGFIRTTSEFSAGSPRFVIGGLVQKRFEGEVRALAQMVREFVKLNSLYKGQAVKITTELVDGKEYKMSLNRPPNFLDLSRVNEEELTFSDETQYQIETNVFTLIEKTDLCRQHRVPLKRGVLFEGPYGTGKTLTAFVTAKKAVANGWTFIYLDRVAAIKEALIFARRYAPCVIFAEDIERIVQQADGRTVAIDDVLNTIDGIDGKNQEVLTIFSTNHVEQISKAMLRPGRLDAVISIGAPDAKAAEKLVRVYAKNLLSANESLEEAGKELHGQIPATIREVVERAKLYAISRLGEGAELRITGEDIRRSAVGMKSHLAFLNPKVEAPKTAAERLGESFAEVVAQTKTGDVALIERVEGKVEEIRNLM